MSKLIALCLSTMLLTGCFFNTRPQINFSENFAHPELPNPVQPYTFDFYVITDDNVSEIVKSDEVYVAIEYQETLLFRQFLEDMKRFMLEANGVICYYRETLEEEFCMNQQKYLDGNKYDKSE